MLIQSCQQVLLWTELAIKKYSSHSEKNNTKLNLKVILNIFFISFFFLLDKKL